jgi:hypothetical protein
MPLPLQESWAVRKEFVTDPHILIGRCELLRPADRDLVVTLFGRHGSAELLAHLGHCHAQTIRRRYRKLLSRLHSERFLLAARSLPYLSGEQADLARLHICQGLSLRATARRIGLTYHQARKLLGQVHGVIQNQALLARRLPMPSAPL